MSKLEAFLKKNKRTQEEFEVNLQSFDEPVKMRIVSGEEYQDIQKSSFITVRKGRKTEKELDPMKFNRQLVMASIAYPPLTNTELQQAYDATGETELYNKMFNWAEQSLLLEALMEQSGFDQDINDEVEEAKN